MALNHLAPKLYRVRVLALHCVSLGAETEPLLRMLVRVRHHLRMEQPREAERLLDVLLARLRRADVASTVRRDSAA
ncbi:hypothetical protein [Nitrospira moscoviensis]|uniref:Uncharacterized protein n=1 Tax=Nitrospira moscoviensis TaxID=42253 RepID=A0A0K2GD05_NITMO|nr:hypothetical protein [Nitrospira moscoviensis]ALA58841.1 hypothetical protein NITMOv2_2428 [Nitrospira moscoviensis]